MDPQDILTNMMSGSIYHSFIHAEDNQVQYYKSCKDVDGDRKYGSHAYHQNLRFEINPWSLRFETCGPQTFCISDIVEVQVSFVGVPLKDKRCKMLVVLRSLALLDGRFSVVRLWSAQITEH